MMHNVNRNRKALAFVEIYDGELTQAYHRFNADCSVEEARWIKDYCSRHGIGSSKFFFNRELDLAE